MRIILALVVVALLAGTVAPAPARAQATSEAIDAIFDWATPAAPGCAVAVARHGEVVVNRAYGLADLERPVPITPDTVFDVGSVQKQFVAAAILLLVEEGQVVLAEDVRTYLPELPDPGHAVTVDRLLTHTSGVRDWTGILPLAATSTDALTIALRQRGLNFAPGEEWSYSNSGYVLLKEIVARRSGVVFGEFARQRLFEPLGMARTRYQYDWREVVANRALAYEQEAGRWRLDVLLDDERGGGGGLLSTAGDLLIWNEALTSGRLGAFVTGKLEEPAQLNNGRTLRYGRGLYLDSNRGGRVVWHTGSANAYNSLLARYPEQGLSIAILCNAGDIAETTVFSRRLFDLFVPATGATGAVDGGSTAAGAPASGLDSKVGLYFSERTGVSLRLMVERGMLRIAGGPPLMPVSDGRFRPAAVSLSFMSQDAFEVQFLGPDHFELVSMEGMRTTFRRAQRYAPTPEDLAAFAGRYESDEIGAVFQIAAGANGLLVRLAHAPVRTLEVRPVAPDIFQVGMVTMRFRRDEAGNVLALDYSSPLLRDVRFSRLGDRGGPR